MKIPINFNPRKYQAAFLREMQSGVKLAVLCWSRRGGKDFTCFGYAVEKMIEQPMNVVWVFPEKEQGRKAFWENIENDGFKTIEHIPKELILRCDNTEMVITLINGSTFRVLGAKSPDALRGANGKLYVFSEFVDIPKAALDVVRPITRNNGGQIVIQSTPKIDGLSGASFQSLFERAKKHPQQFASRITAREYLSAEVLEEIRQECIEENGNDFWFRQEYLCDWGQASSSSYYGQALKLLKDKDQIRFQPYNQQYPVFTVWDWGISDNMAIGFFQFYRINGEPTVSIIDSDEMNDIGIKQAVAFIKMKKYTYAWHFFPHDITVRDSDLVERIEKFRNEGLINSSILKREGRDDGIERVVNWLKKTIFNEDTTKTLRRKMALYKRKFNPKTGDYIGPEHDSASHFADMLRYLYKAIEDEFNQETCEHFYSQAQDEQLYESELVATNFYQPGYQN